MNRIRTPASGFPCNVSRPLTGNPPTIAIAAGYRADNPSPVLASFLQNIDLLIASHAAAAGGNSGDGTG